jgi:PglZ domain
MILESLVSQLEQRFQHEKRAQVCLWFDEKVEFARLLPTLRTHLDQMKRPLFVLLEYDAGATHGQIWLKHLVHQVLSQAANAEERRRLRFVLYVPLSEDRLDVAADNTVDDGVRLDLLEEYRTGGVLWRIGGKRPTLFSFLRLAGVALPDNAPDQRRLWDGGRDSLLAKYVAKFADRPAVYWDTQLTPELAQSRLIDVDQTVLELALEPEETWKALQQKGLDREFLEMVRERYGFDVPVHAPEEWIEEFVAILALTETFLGYGEPADFPFADRLPALAVRPHHRQLLQRWLRDAEYRAAWDRCVKAVEAKVDLTAWAKGRTGLSFGFPHLSWLRLKQTYEAFDAAATKDSTTAAFFEGHTELIAKEAEFAKASAQGGAKWVLLRDLRAFIDDCARGMVRVQSAGSAADLVRVYVDHASLIEWRHTELRHGAEAEGHASVGRVADRAYAAYALALNDAFFQRVAATGTLEVPGVPGVTSRLEYTLWKAKGRRAVVIVDALRYDCALAVRDQLRGHAVEVEPLLAMLPTVTPVGMTALLPMGDGEVTIEIKGNAIHPRLNGKDTSVRENRLAILKAFGADCREITDVEQSSDTPSGLGELLVVFGHEDVDHIGHGQAETLIRHVHLEIDRLARLVRKLHRWGYARVHVVTDHGFVMLDESKLPSEVPCDKTWCHVLKERYALVPASADLPLVRFPFAWDPEIRVAVPPGLAFFKAEKSFSHGGAAVQELIIPHLVSRGQATQEKRVGVEVVLPTYELQRTAVKVIVRPAAASTSKVGQMALFTESGRTLALDVVRREPGDKTASVLAGKPKEVLLDPQGQEQSVTLFFHTAARFRTGELLELDIRDVETFEQFPPGGIKLTVGRDM